MAKLGLENIPAERAILGAVLRDVGIFYDNRNRFRRELFLDPINQRIAEVLNTLAAANREISVPAILGLMPVDLPINPEAYIGTLMVEEAEVTVPTDLLDLLTQTWARREAVNLGQRLISKSVDDGDGDAVERLEAAVAETRAIAEAVVHDQRMTADTAVDRMLTQVAAAYKKKTSGGIPYFIPDLKRILSDQLEYGWITGLLCDSGGGKTSISLQQVLFCSASGIPSLFISGDQIVEDCYRQLASIDLGIESTSLRHGTLTDVEWRKLDARAREYKRMPLVIEKMRRSCRTSDISNSVRAFRRRYGRGLVVIDHVKKIRFDDPRAGLSEGVNQVNNDLKDIMVDNDCSGLILMQRNSEGARRDNPRPLIGDIYGGAGAAEPYDVVIALYVEELHLTRQMKMFRETTQKWDELNARKNVVHDLAELIALKVRFGPPDRSATIRREARYTRFHTRMKDNAVGDFLEDMGR